MLKVAQQLVDGYKKIRCFNVIEVPVVTLAALVVITYSALAACAKVQPVFVQVSAGVQRFGNAPHHDFNHCAVVSYLFGSGDLRCLYLYCILAMHCKFAIYELKDSLKIKITHHLTLQPNRFVRKQLLII